MKNPILNFVTDDVYQTLVELNLLNMKTIRDIEIKRQYIRLRKKGSCSADALETILEEHPYLQFDTLRKIIYTVKLPEELDIDQHTHKPFSA